MSYQHREPDWPIQSCPLPNLLVDASFSQNKFNREMLGKCCGWCLSYLRKEKNLFLVGFQNNNVINACKSTYRFTQHPIRTHGLAREPLTAWHARATNIFKSSLLPHGQLDFAILGKYTPWLPVVKVLLPNTKWAFCQICLGLVVVGPKTVSSGLE